MPDPVERARRYRTKEQECRRLSELAQSPDLKDRYKDLADVYGRLAQAEENLAAEQSNADDG